MVITVRVPDLREPIRRFVMAGVSSWRWVGLVAVAAASAHHQIAGRDALASVIAPAGASLVPLDFVYGVWGSVLLVLLGLAFVGLLEDQRRVAFHDRVSGHIVAASLLSSVQLVMLALANIHVTAAIAVLLALVALDAYRTTQRAIRAGETIRWVGAPFALLLGASGAIAMVSIDAAITAAGCPSTAPALALVIGAGLAATRLGGEAREPLLPAYFAVVLIGLCAASVPASIVSAALIMGVVCGATAMLIVATGGVVPVKPSAPRRRVNRHTPFADAVSRNRFGGPHSPASTGSLHLGPLVAASPSAGSLHLGPLAPASPSAGSFHPGR